MAAVNEWLVVTLRQRPPSYTSVGMLFTFYRTLVRITYWWSFVGSLSLTRYLAGLIGSDDHQHVLSCLTSSTFAEKPCSHVKEFVNKVYKHICCHANLTDLWLFLQRHFMWNEDVANYIYKYFGQCTSCCATSPPQTSRKLSISSVSKGLNDVVCLDHIYFGILRLFLAMNHSTRLSVAYLIQDASMDQAVVSFKTCWTSPSWLPCSIPADKAFAAGSYCQFCKNRDIKLAPGSVSWHSCYAIESKHGIIRSLILKLSSAYPDASLELLEVQAVAISNDIYGNDTVSAFKLVKGFTKTCLPKSRTRCPWGHRWRTAQAKYQT